MKKVAVVVGSGFSVALTGGSAPLFGNQPLPSLAALSAELVQHIEARRKSGEDFSPLVPELIEETLAVLKAPAASDFEQLMSRLEIRANLLENSLGPIPSRSKAWPSRSILRCIMFFLYDLFASRLSYDGKRRANRNFHYKVNDSQRAAEFRRHFYKLADEYEVSFISFNYDGLVEALLDCELGKQPLIFRYFPEISHGVPIVMPEHFLGRDTRDFSRWKVPLVLKPHGSIHFFRAREDIRSLRNGADLIAIHPRLDLDFNPATMQRDIPDQDILRYADPVPFIVPPVLNKDSYLDSTYSKVVWGQAIRALSEADAILAFGFSIPWSDMYVGTLFEAADSSRRRIALCFRNSANDRTLENWSRVFTKAKIDVLVHDGIAVSSLKEVGAF